MHKIRFSSLNFEKFVFRPRILKSSFFIPEFWRSLFLHMNFVPELFFKGTKFMCKKDFFFKFRDEKQTFQSSGTKNELHTKFGDENNSLTYLFLSWKSIYNECGQPHQENRWKFNVSHRWSSWIYNLSRGDDSNNIWWLYCTCWI